MRLLATSLPPKLEDEAAKLEIISLYIYFFTQISNFFVSIVSFPYERIFLNGIKIFYIFLYIYKTRSYSLLSVNVNSLYLICLTLLFIYKLIYNFKDIANLFEKMKSILKILAF